ncbi:hypothetical protein MKW92_008224 [Papaver armeniacum]|nr:hypothetical protein MKW92_008224 [Papaver armeniacum]
MSVNIIEGRQNVITEKCTTQTFSPSTPCASLLQPLHNKILNAVLDPPNLLYIPTKHSSHFTLVGFFKYNTSYPAQMATARTSSVVFIFVVVLGVSLCSASRALLNLGGASNGAGYGIGNGGGSGYGGGSAGGGGGSSGGSGYAVGGEHSVEHGYGGNYGGDHGAGYGAGSGSGSGSGGGYGNGIEHGVGYGGGGGGGSGSGSGYGVGESMV